MRRLFASLALAVLLCVGLSFSPPPDPVTYYVNQLADPGGDGTTQALTGAHCAWDTLADVNGASFSPGDSAFISRGTPAPVYREQLTVPSSGSAGLPITFGAYGTGADPIISGADVVTGWTEYGSAQHGGNYCVRVDIDGSGSDAGINQTITLAATTAYTITFWYKTVSGSIIQMSFEKVGAGRFLKTDGAWQDGWANFTGGIGNANWTQFSLGFTSETSGTYKLTTYRTGAAANQSYYADDFSIANGGEKLTDGGLENWNSATDLTSWAESKAGTSSVNQAGGSTTWQATLTTEPVSVWFDGTFGDKKTSIGACVNEFDWHWASNVLYCYSTTDPDTAYTTIEATSRASCIDTNVKSYLTIDGLYLDKPKIQNILVQCTNAIRPTNITIQNLSAYYSDTYAIMIGGTATNLLTPNNVTIDNCDIVKWHRAYMVAAGPGTVSAPGIYQPIGDGTGGDNLWVKNCLIQSDLVATESNNDRNGIQVMAGDGIIIEYNELNTPEHGIYIKGAAAAGGAAETYIIRCNNFHDTRDDCIWLSQTTQTDSVICYNRMYNSVNGEFMHLQSCGNYSYGSIYNNAMDTSYDAGILIIYGCKNTNFKNNIISNYGTHGTVGQNCAIRLDAGTTTYGTGSSFNYNQYYKAGNTTPFWETTLGARTLAQWKVNMSDEASSLNSDPLFVSASNFNLQSTSPCINAGTDVGLTTDYAGTRVPQGPKPDIGAYERLRRTFLLFLDRSLTWQ